MFLQPLETILNRNIAASSAARSACKRLSGKNLAVHINATSTTTLLSFVIHCEGERVALTTKADEPAAATLFGTPLAYLGMLRAQAESGQRTAGIHIEGDAETAQSFRDLLKAAQPDVEEELARVIGDVPAHQLGNFARDAINFGRKVVDTLGQNISEYLQEETRDVVTRTEVDEFIADIDKLREAVDRAEARLNNLEQR